MKDDNTNPVIPWSKGTAATGVDRRLAELFGAIPPAEGLSATELASVRRRLATRDHRGSARSPRRGLLLVFAIVVGSSSAFAQWAQPGWWRQLAPRFLTEAAPAVSHAPTQRRLAKTSTAAVGTPGVPAGEQQAPAPEVPPAANAQSEGLRSPVVLAPSSIARESESLKRILAKLHRERDPQAALALLDAHQVEFPRGQLAVEAAAARVDALLLTGQKADALKLLVRFPLEHSGRKHEFRLLRAELLAEGNCQRALSDFDALLSAASAAPFHERALYGRAGCRLRLGNDSGGKADLEQYLTRYPQGRFVPQVQRHLTAP